MQQKNPAPEDTFDYAAAAANLRKRFEKRHKDRIELHRRASSDCGAIVEMIKKEFNPGRIYQWGSLLHPEQFDENSDIDIAIEGLESAEAWFALTGKAMEMTRFPLDIIELEHVNPLDRNAIVNKGKLVYERST